MWNTVKMELYRMLHMKCFYGLLAMMMGLTGLYAGVVFWDTSDMVLSTLQSILDCSVEGIMHKIYGGGAMALLFLVIFVILYVRQDISSGYIKNIGGQFVHPMKLVGVKTIVVALYLAVVFIIGFVEICVLDLLLTGKIFIHDTSYLGRVVLVDYIMSLAFLSFCFFLCTLLRNTTAVMSIGILLVMGIMDIVYVAIDFALGKIGIENAHIEDISLLSTFSGLSDELLWSEVSHGIVMAAIYFFGSLILNCLLFEKRDIV